MVLRKVNRHIQKQWATISRFLGQRRFGLADDSPYCECLALADQQAADYYHRFKEPKAGDVPPRVYFGKLYNITRFPYQPVPLIAIPLADWDRPEDWLSLAHELGHYVFWNDAKLESYQKVQNRFTRAVKKASDHTRVVTNTWQFWLEESFADLFGTLVAGPAYALNAQDRLVRDELSQASDLLCDDGQHPMSAVRPLLAAEALRHLEGGERAADRLVERWQPYLERAQGFFSPPKKEAGTDSSPFALSDGPSPGDLAAMVPIIVDKLLNTPALQAKIPLLNSRINDVSWWAEEWTKFAALDIPPLPLLPENDIPTEERPQLIVEPEDTYHSKSFCQLRRFIQREIKDGREQSPEWKVLLNLKLSQTSGEAHPKEITDQSSPYPNIKPHTHYLKSHRHIGNTIECKIEGKISWEEIYPDKGMVNISRKLG